MEFKRLVLLPGVRGPFWELSEKFYGDWGETQPQKLPVLKLFVRPPPPAAGAGQQQRRDPQPSGAPRAGAQLGGGHASRGGQGASGSGTRRRTLADADEEARNGGVGRPAGLPDRPRCAARGPPPSAFGWETPSALPQPRGSQERPTSPAGRRGALARRRAPCCTPPAARRTRRRKTRRAPLQEGYRGRIPGQNPLTLRLRAGGCPSSSCLLRSASVLSARFLSSGRVSTARNPR